MAGGLFKCFLYVCKCLYLLNSCLYDVKLCKYLCKRSRIRCFKQLNAFRLAREAVETPSPVGWETQSPTKRAVRRESQRKAARVVGFTYLFTNVTAIFAEFYVRAHLIVYDNAAETARNIMASERLFRLSIASDLIAFAGDVVLIVALYVILKRVNQSLALLAAFWRLVETSICVVMTLGSFDVLRLLSGADYLRVFEADRLQALARLYIGAHGAGYNVGLMFFGLGSTVFSYLCADSDEGGH